MCPLCGGSTVCNIDRFFIFIICKATIEENIRREYTTYTRELEEKIERLEEDLKTKKRSRVVQPQVAESTSTTATLPSAAVRPTVTTTPTASIRPMPLQITTAPTAHVTPTQVSTSVPSTVEATATQSSNSQLASATVFVRSTSPLVQPGPSRSQMMPSTSSSGEADNSRPSIKRSRDEAKYACFIMQLTCTCMYYSGILLFQPHLGPTKVAG